MHRYVKGYGSPQWGHPAAVIDQRRIEMKNGKFLASARCIHCLDIQGLIAGKYSRVHHSRCAISIVSCWGNFGARQGVTIVGLGDQEIVVAEACGPRTDGKFGSSASCTLGSTRPFRPLHTTLRTARRSRPPAIPRRRQRLNAYMIRSPLALGLSGDRNLW